MIGPLIKGCKVQLESEISWNLAEASRKCCLCSGLSTPLPVA